MLVCFDVECGDFHFLQQFSSFETAENTAVWFLFSKVEAEGSLTTAFVSSHPA
jgi:hypothetical protein